MINFQPDTVSFNDPAGAGMWDDGHHREHLAFVQALAAQTPPILLPNYDFLSFLSAGPARPAILQTHAQAHTLLRSFLGITGIDYAKVHLGSEDDFNSFLGYHSTEHAQIRQSLGI